MLIGAAILLSRKNLNNSVDNMAQRKWTIVYQDVDLSDNVVVWYKQNLSYNPENRQGFYREGIYLIGSKDRLDMNYQTIDGVLSLRKFSTEQEAIDYFISIFTIGTSDGGGGIPDGFTPEVFPDDVDDDDVVPTPQPIDPINPPIDPDDLTPIDPTPIDPIAPINPPSGFGDFDSGFGVGVGGF